MSSSSSFPSESRFKFHIHPIKNIDYRQIWEKFNQTINDESIYRPTTDVDEIIYALRRSKIVKVDLYSPSTFSAYKWMIVLEGGQHVLFKPALINKTVKASVNCVSGCEHPEYEIAGFALNRLFGLRNMPYTTGRRVSWDQEIAPVATEVLKKSVTVREDGDICIVWTCYLEYESRYCFEKGIIYGALVYWIGNKTVVQRVADKASWHHEYHAMGDFLANFSSILPGNRTYCDQFRKREPYSDMVSFGYILDMAAIDFLMLNYDGGKHTYIANRNDTIRLNILIDYGLSFCDRNDPILLAPIYQCCRIRKKLYKSLLKYSANLTEAFDETTKDDPLYPLLLPMDLTVIQQRLNTIITIIEICFKKYGEMGVLL
ncbi:hypothetical protein ACJMK2_035741 [Sinanodonta woodiana]|uniref:FAM20 C-terminal domain-containing protein n=1 Tax=Sinanodonta woodiana TaxID=1069815 RepID=A0ABD3WF74_SINWO